LDYGKAAPGSVQAMYKLQKYVDESGLEHSLLELVKTRVSQINVSAWREAPYYSERERAALAWAEVVTLISQTHASDAEYEAARSQFSEEELVKLTMAVIAINGWNRLAITFRPEVGKYQPRAKVE
jgi:alkylhydroperoxidase family enzyme